MRTRSLLAALLAFTVTLGLSPALGGAQTAHASPDSVYTVNSVLDQPDANPGDGDCVSTPSGVCTLRAAIMEANADATADFIFLPGGTTYQLQIVGQNENAAAQGDLDITHDLTILGTTQSQPVIDGHRAITFDRVFHVLNNSVVILDNLYIWDGWADTGGAIRIEAGSQLTLDSSHLKDNKAGTDGGTIANYGTLVMTDTNIDYSTAVGSGGAIYNAGTATVSGAVLNLDSAQGDGGGIASTGTLNLTDSIVEADTAGGYGGGIDNAGVLKIVRSTLYYNNAPFGGGLRNHTGGQVVTLTNSTISGNWATGSGGGLYVGTGTVSLFNVTVAQNIADKNLKKTFVGGGIANIGGVVNFANTLIAGNSNGANGANAGDCSGTLTSQGYNLVQDPTGCSIGGSATGNLTGQSAQLSLLMNWGGPTLSHKLLPGSAAVDAGNPNGCKDSQSVNLTVDQRGVGRPFDGNSDGLARCDIGAFEVNTPYFSLFVPVVVK